ncbi:MAG: hypothetical protein ABIK73_06170 [candidate division WOR-3 bacterium]
MPAATALERLVVDKFNAVPIINLNSPNAAKSLLRDGSTYAETCKNIFIVNNKLSRAYIFNSVLLTELSTYDYRGNYKRSLFFRNSTTNVRSLNRETAAWSTVFSGDWTDSYITVANCNGVGFYVGKSKYYDTYTQTLKTTTDTNDKFVADEQNARLLYFKNASTDLNTTDYPALHYSSFDELDNLQLHTDFDTGFKSYSESARFDELGERGALYFPKLTYSMLSKYRNVFILYSNNRVILIAPSRSSVGYDKRILSDNGIISALSQYDSLYVGIDKTIRKITEDGEIVALTPALNLLASGIYTPFIRTLDMNDLAFDAIYLANVTSKNKTYVINLQNKEYVEIDALLIPLQHVDAISVALPQSVYKSSVILPPYPEMTLKRIIVDAVGTFTFKLHYRIKRTLSYNTSTLSIDDRGVWDGDNIPVESFQYTIETTDDTFVLNKIIFEFDIPKTRR